MNITNGTQFMKFDRDGNVYLDNSEVPVVHKCDRWYGTKHLYGKWVELKRANITKDSNGAVVGLAIYQERICQACGFKHIRLNSVYF